MRGILGGGHKPAGSGGEKAPDGPEDETEQLDDAQGNVLLHMISQLKPGSDLSRISFPTFVLEPRSMLERITDFLSHPDLIFGAGEIEDPNERFIQVLRYYLAGWHIKPKGVKKPYNPILGEIFRCRYEYKDGSRGFYVAEQVSHHPPISAFYYASPENKLEIFGELRPKSRFLGNSAMNEMGGYNHIALLDRPEDGEYDISMPNMYARGILFGKMVLELGDIAKVSNDNTNVHCDVEFKTKGFFSGTYNAISGKVKSPKGELGEISGKWSDQMYIQRKGGRELFFDADKATAVPKTLQPESEQQENESRRLWSKVTEAIKRNDQDAATDAKSAIEDRQRELAKQREASGEKWAPKYFALNKRDEHRPVFSLPQGSATEQTEALEQWIFGTSSSGSSKRTEAAPASLSSSTNTAVTAEEGEDPQSAPAAPAKTQAAPVPASAPAPAAAPAVTTSTSSTGTTAPSSATSSSTPQNMASTPTSARSTGGPGSQPSSPDNSYGGFLKRATRKLHAASISSHKSDTPPGTVPDHEASSRHIP